jgi:transposase
VQAAEKEMERALDSWSLASHVKALMGLKGVDLVTAFTIMAELGDLSRFDSAPQFMAYLGVVPGEHLSGSKVRRGSITKTGKGHVRKVIVEAAWSYRLKPLKSKALLQRQDGLDPEVRQISWEAQKRLSHRYRHLTQAGKKKTVAIAAIARELAGFIWAIGCHQSGRNVDVPPSLSA